MISAFGRYIVSERGLDRAAGRALNDLHDIRSRADYTLDPVSASHARTAIERAQNVIDTVEAWLAKPR